jgi:hypothetical protein
LIPAMTGEFWRTRRMPAGATNPAAPISPRRMGDR